MYYFKIYRINLLKITESGQNLTNFDTLLKASIKGHIIYPEKSECIILGFRVLLQESKLLVLDI